MSGERAQVVLVTGASSGLGRAISEHLAGQGRRVWGTSRSSGFAPEGLRGLVLDVDDDASVERGVGELLASEGRIDAVVNNAGFGLAGAVEDTSIDEAKRQMETNFFGVLRVIRAVLPSMRERRRGTIVNIGSLGGRIGLPFQGLYSASKFALEGLSESLRQEVAPWGVRVVLVEPGDFATAITDNRLRAAAAGRGSAYAEAFRATLDVVEREETGGAQPRLAARLVARLLDDPDPGLRHTVGHPSQRLSLLAKGLLPPSWFERLLMSHYGLGGKA